MESNLLTKGFERDAQGHHIFFRHQVDGKYSSAFAKISHSKKMKDISRDILTSIKRQLKLDRTQEAKDLLECPMSGEEYNQILRRKGIL